MVRPSVAADQAQYAFATALRLTRPVRTYRSNHSLLREFQMSTCEKHAKDPARGYSPCAGCEIERLQSALVDAIKLPTAKALMAKLEPEICVPWRSDCAGQIFLDTGAEDEVRIGHFQVRRRPGSLPALTPTRLQATLKAAQQ